MWCLHWRKKKIMLPERVNYWCLKSIFPYFLVRSDMSLNTQHQYQKWDFLEVVTETGIFFVIVFFLTEKKYKCSSGSQEKKFNPDSRKKKKPTPTGKTSPSTMHVARRTLKEIVLGWHWQDVNNRSCIMCNLFKYLFPYCLVWTTKVYLGCCSHASNSEARIKRVTSVKHIETCGWNSHS